MLLPPASERPLRPIAAIADAGLFAEVSVGVRAAAYCAVCFFGGLLFVTRGGLIWLDLVDGYGLSLALFTVGVLECVGIGWLYGVPRVASDVREMAGAEMPRALLLHIKCAHSMLWY